MQPQQKVQQTLSGLSTAQLACHSVASRRPNDFSWDLGNTSLTYGSRMVCIGYNNSKYVLAAHLQVRRIWSALDTPLELQNLLSTTTISLADSQNSWQDTSSTRLPFDGHIPLQQPFWLSLAASLSSSQFQDRSQARHQCF